MLGVVAAVVLAVVICLPLFLDWYATRWLQERGLVDADIEDIDLDLFRGRLGIDGLTLTKEEERRNLATRCSTLSLLAMRILAVSSGASCSSIVHRAGCVCSLNPSALTVLPRPMQLPSRRTEASLRSGSEICRAALSAA